MRFDENPIWRKLEVFSIDPPDVSLTFTQRLARENDWSEQFASEVLLEYKKFLFLCATQSSSCTPPDAVDQAWHLHLAYTKSYWQDLCENVLVKQLHHNPTEGGAGEQDKYFNQYYQTWMLYKAVFMADPPENIWPNPLSRFGDEQFKRIDTRKNFMVNKERFTILIPIMILGWIVGVAANSFAVPFFATFIGILILFSHNISGSFSTGECGTSGDGGDSGCGSGCSGCGGGD